MFNAQNVCKKRPRIKMEVVQHRCNALESSGSIEILKLVINVLMHQIVLLAVQFKENYSVYPALNQDQVFWLMGLVQNVVQALILMELYVCLALLSQIVKNAWYNSYISN